MTDTSQALQGPDLVSRIVFILLYTETIIYDYNYSLWHSAPAATKGSGPDVALHSRPSDSRNSHLPDIRSPWTPDDECGTEALSFLKIANLF